MKPSLFTPSLGLAVAGLLLTALVAWGQVPVLVKDIKPGSGGSVPYNLAPVNGVLYFAAEDNPHGRELWKSDGTQAGTVLVKDIRPGQDDSTPDYLLNVNGTLYFSADDGTDGFELWKSDGTAAGTVLVKDINPSGDSKPEDLIVVNGTLFFSANDGVHGRELWKSDGTAAGTVLVRDVNPGGEDALEDLESYVRNPMIDFNGTLYFPATDGSTGVELWKSDGTAAGTERVSDIRPGPGASWPEEALVANGFLFFQAGDGVHGRELWKSDGTAAGTVLVKDIYPDGSSSPGGLTNVNGTLFFSARTAEYDRELWKSDGTAAGTVRVKDIVPGPEDGSYPDDLLNVNGTLFFSASSVEYARELWKSDGTEAGTVLVKDINPGGEQAGGYSYAQQLTLVNGTVYFLAETGKTGFELWKTDGTEAGTVLVKDIWPGPESSIPEYLTNVNGTLFFGADDGVLGPELWKIAAPPPPCDARVAGSPTTPSRVCRDAPLPVAFALAGNCPVPLVNTFVVQLSNAVGSFNNPTVLGTATPGTTSLPLPASLPLGTGYRVRILSGGQTSGASQPFQLVGPSLGATPTVGGTPVCRGNQVTVNFSLAAGSCPFPEGNAFTAQLSSAFGSFNNPTDLGIVTPGQSTVTIPAGVSAGSGYRIRVVSGNPALTSASSAPFQVRACANHLSAEEPQLTVAPNPVRNGEIRVRVSGMDSPVFGLTTPTGRGLNLSVKTNGLGDFVLTPRHRLPTGVYVLQASQGAAHLTTRVLVTD